MKQTARDTGPDSGCQLEPVADNDLGSVAVCRCCGGLHVTLQQVTMRLHASTFSELVELLRSAQLRLKDAPPADASRALVAAGLVH
jgi:hypothetical protein